MTSTAKGRRPAYLADSPGLTKALRRLADPNVSLIERRDGDHVEFHYVRRGGRASLGAGTLSTTLALELCSRGLIERRGNDWHLAAAGHAFLRRTDHGEASFIAQHAVLEKVQIGRGENRQQVTRNAAESPLSWLRSRKGHDGQSLVSDSQYEAGERLRRDFTRAHMMPRMGVTWAPLANRAPQRGGGAGAQVDMAVHVLDARARVHKALDVVGSEFASPLIDVCCLLQALEEVEDANRWPRRSGKLVLRLALNALARHYGLIAETKRSGWHVVRHWGGDRYRPAIK